MKKILLINAILIIAISFKTMAQVPNYLPTNGLASYWPFSGNANDQSINAKNGTVHNAVLTTDRFGNANSAYYFNGTNSYIQVPDNNDSILDLTHNFTISVWASIEQLVGNGPTMLCKHIANLDNMGSYEFITGYVTPLSQYKLVFFATPHYDNTAYSSFNSFSNNTWVNYTCSYNYLSQNCIYYVNGLPVDTVNINFDINNTTIDFLIGCTFIDNTANYAYFWKGKLDDIGIWNRDLTQCEIYQIYSGSSFSITTQPQSQTVNITNDAQFTISMLDTTGITYHWQTDLGLGFQDISNAGQYNGATDDILHIANTTLLNNNQQFRCKITSGICFDTSNVATLTVINNTSMNEISTSNLISVFPNPATNKININIASQLKESTYFISNAIGNIVLSGKINFENSVIDISTLTNGVYLFNIGANAKQTFKVVKQE